MSSAWSTQQFCYDRATSYALLISYGNYLNSMYAYKKIIRLQLYVSHLKLLTEIRFYVASQHMICNSNKRLVLVSVYLVFSRIMSRIKKACFASQTSPTLA